jgi:ABC-type branched-subunit amino acid transport system substrate-binding protein
MTKTRGIKGFTVGLAFIVITGLLGGERPAAAKEPILFGFNVPLSGAYALQGEDQLKAYMLAVKKINQNGGLLGREIEYLVLDTQTNAETARRNARELIEEGAVMITGGSSSAVAIAQCEVCQNAGVVFMAALTHSNETTGRHGHRHCFRWYNNGHQSAKALSKTLLDNYGKTAKYAYIYADYTWGQTVMQSMKTVLEAAGGKTVAALPTPLGAKSYVKELFRARKEKPDVLVLVHFGADMINALQQVDKLKFREEMAVVVPLMELHMAKEVGPPIMRGIITSFCWYHALSEKFSGSKAFVESFEETWNKKPGNAAAVGWVNIFQYVDAVRRAKSLKAKAVINALEGHRFTQLLGEEYFREWDHQGIHPTFVAMGKSPEESKNEWDLFNIIDEVPGESVARTREENPVRLEPF